MQQAFSQIRQQISDRLTHTEVIYDSSILSRWAAVHLILHFNESWKLAMIKRVENPNDPWSGHYAFPGGRVEAGESHEEAAQRETYEEIGLATDKSDFLGRFYSFQIKVKNQPINLGISAHLSVSQGHSPAFTVDPSEVAQAYWFELAELIEPKNITLQNFSFSIGEKILPCIKFDGHTIWGISYHILRELLNQLSGLNLAENLLLNPDILPSK